MLKRSLLFLTVLLLLFSFSSITNEVSASSSFDKGKYKKGDDASYFEPTGPYLMVNVTGVDGKGNELLSPHYVEFPIKPGTTLTKEKIEYYVEWALDATAYKEFRVVELDPSAKIEVTYYDKNKKKRRNEVFPYNRKRFCCPRFIRAY